MTNNPHDLPPPRTLPATPGCRCSAVRQHQRDADLAALVDQGRGDVPQESSVRRDRPAPLRETALSLDLLVRCRDLAGQPVELYRHDEIVLVQTFDLLLIFFVRSETVA